jgi:hypothetical protein
MIRSGKRTNLLLHITLSCTIDGALLVARERMERYYLLMNLLLSWKGQLVQSIPPGYEHATREAETVSGGGTEEVAARNTEDAER